MNKPKDTNSVRVEIFSMALAEAIPDPAVLCVPADEIAAALEAFLAYDDGVLDEAPLAFDVYLANQQSIE